MNIKSIFISKFNTSDFITKSKASVFFYYSMLMLFLLCMLIGLYSIMPISADLRTKGYLGAVGISVLVIGSLLFLRT